MPRHTLPDGRVVVTVYVYPPIPPRGFDWMAYFQDQEEGLSASGATEQAAIAELVELDNVSR